LEERFRVEPGPEHRAVYGKSSGGYGALVQGMRHAKHWGAVACHSGDMGFDSLYLRDFPSTVDVLSRRGGDIARFIEEFEAAPKVKGHELHALMILTMAATYAPEQDAPMGIRLPVDLHTCELDEERWARWLAHDPVRMVEDERCQDNLARLRGLFIDCGSRDQYFLHYGARTLAKRLTDRGIPHVYEEFDDNHSSIDYRLDASLPYLYRALRR
jgi:S-formylglutathione hydrolase FrmB